MVSEGDSDLAEDVKSLRLDSIDDLGKDEGAFEALDVVDLGALEDEEVFEALDIVDATALKL